MAERLRGIILDVDGTLVDSNEAHAHAWMEALAEQGIAAEFEKVRRCVGMGGDKLLPRVAGIEESSPIGKKVSERRGKIFLHRFLPNLRPTPGATELLQQLHEVGYRLAVASSAKKDELRPLLKLCGADELIETKTSSDDAEASKPDPDIVAAALNRLALPSNQTLMLGDTPYDIEAASRAGVSTIALRCGGWEERDLAGAMAVYDDPADLLAHFDSSPLGTGAVASGEVL